MKKIVFINLILIFYLFSTISFATDFSGTPTTGSLFIPNSGSSYYAYSGSFSVGQKYHAAQEEREKSRTQYAFFLGSIPTNALINSVNLSYSIFDYNEGTYKLKIVIIDQTFSPQAIYEEVGSGTSLFSNIQYSSLSGNLNSTTLTNLVNNNKGGSIFLGAISQNEISSGSYATLNLTLKINYSIPVQITVDNNFTASDNTHGSVKVDGVSRTAPHTFTKYTGQNVTLEAISPQTDNQGYQRIWHTGSTNPSDWERGQDFISNTKSYTFEIAANDNNVTYTANLRQVATTTSGTLNQNETWFTTVTLTGNVSVPSGITLTIKPDAVVNLNTKYLKSTGGSIIRESGSTINGLQAYLKSGTTLKGFFPSLSSAVDNSSTNQTIELLPSTTYSGNISYTGKDYLKIAGASNGTSVIDGNITLTNCTDFDLSNLKMHNGHSITINSSSGSDTHFITFMGSGSINQYNGSGNHASGLVHNAASTSAAIYYYNTSGNAWGVDITDHDFGIWATANASMNVSTSTFCDNMLDLYANSGGYIYAPNNTMSAPWPQSIGGNVSGYSSYVCSKQLSKSDLLVEGIEDTPLPEEINLLNAEYAELLKRITDENEDKSPSVLLGYKPEFDAIIKDYKALLTVNSSPIETTAILSKIEKCYY